MSGPPSRGAAGEADEHEEEVRATLRDLFGALQVPASATLPAPPSASATFSPGSLSPVGSRVPPVLPARRASLSALSLPLASPPPPPVPPRPFVSPQSGVPLDDDTMAEVRAALSFAVDRVVLTASRSENSLLPEERNALSLPPPPPLPRRSSLTSSSSSSLSPSSSSSSVAPQLTVAPPSAVDAAVAGALAGVFGGLGRTAREEADDDHSHRHAAESVSLSLHALVQSVEDSVRRDERAAAAATAAASPPPSATTTPSTAARSTTSRTPRTG